MHEYVSMWEHGLLQHPGMPMLPWPALRCWERDRRCRRAFPAGCNLANSIHSYLLCLAPCNHWPVLHTWSCNTVVESRGRVCGRRKKLSVFFVFGTVDWKSDNRFSMLFIARPPFKANKLWTFFLTYCHVGILQDNFRILPICCFWNYFLWIGMKLAWRCAHLPGLLFALGMFSIPFVIFPQNYTAKCVLNCFHSTARCTLHDC